jgi:hypothetical protein
MTFNEFIQQCAEHPLSEDRVTAFCSEHSLTRSSFLDSCSRYIAHSYSRGELDYTVCDLAINHLVSFADFQVSKYTWAIFLAFDEGEFAHSGDSRDTNPEEKYTRARIAEIITDEPVA